MGAVMTSFFIPHLGVAGFAKNIVIPSSQSASNRSIRFPNQNKKKTKRKQNKRKNKSAQHLKVKLSQVATPGNTQAGGNAPPACLTI